jgi:hypothetical protein
MMQGLRPIRISRRAGTPVARCLRGPGNAVTEGGAVRPEDDFSWAALWEALETERNARGLSLTGMNNEIAWFGMGVLHGIRDAKGTTCQHVTGPLRWLDRSPESLTPGCADWSPTTLPDWPGRAIRWSLPTLQRVLDETRVARDLAWSDVAHELGWGTAAVRGIGRLRYGIPMIYAMRIVQWTGRPSRTFFYDAGPHVTFARPLTGPGAAP